MLLLHSIMQVVVEVVGEAHLVETDPATTEKEAKEPEEEIEKMESNSTTIDCEEEANLTLTLPVDNNVAVSPPFTKPMTKHDGEINQIIDEITKSDDEQEDVPF
ncbi:hypothetical protein J1N35_040918 [Gossypium stocksii]|uniref:Uncharacterized protein n=1 Tax=Gossypium stocksii TaxID=47602 RepID=A0A9D3ZI63_9ROSI|nr:hypothetical protein J1N35_040918 [Gossypium stocksii]